MLAGSHLTKFVFLGLALASVPVTASADVRSGVEAWSRGDYESAIKQWREPAGKGDADAQFNMGQAYKLGRGVKMDVDIALEWYKKAAEQGHLQASDSYGHLLHFRGKILESLSYLQASSDRGDPRAQYLLATELFNGVYIKKDWVRAYALMTRASSAGMPSASRSLAQMDQYIPLEQRQAAATLALEPARQAGRPRNALLGHFPGSSSQPLKQTQAATGQATETPTGLQAKASETNLPAPEPITAQPEPKSVSINNMPAETVANEGTWRVQLGAFGDPANARNLWSTLKSSVSELESLEPDFSASGRLTRLLAGPFTSKSVADSVCAKIRTSGQSCLVVEP